MSEKHPLVPIEGASERTEPMMYMPSEPERQSAPMRRVHSIMRGRYKWAALLGVLFAVAGGLLGWRLTVPIYRCYGTIRVQPILPKVLYSTDQSNLLPMFDAYVGAQVVMIQSSRVIAKAMERPTWKQVNWKPDGDPMETFSENLQVDHPHGSEVIFVNFYDPDPKAAQKAVEAIVDSYAEIYGESDQSVTNRTLETLEQRKTGLRNDLASQQRLEQSITNEFGSKDLDQIHQLKLVEVSRLEQQVKDLQIQIRLAESYIEAQKNARKGVDGAAGKPDASAPGAAPAPDAAPAPAPAADAPAVAEAPKPAPADAPAPDATASAANPAGPPQLSPEEIGLRDVNMRELLNERDGVDRQLKQMSLTLGENHRQVVQVRTLLDAINRKIVEYAAKVNEQIALSPEGAGPGVAALPQLHERLDALQELYNKTKAEAVDLGQKNLRLAALKAEEETIRERFDETEHRIEQLRVEQAVSGRVSVINKGDVPQRPFRDRRQGLAAVGALMGGAFGFGIVLLIGSMDRRLRSLDDAADTLGRLTMLGILPRLPDDLAEPEHAAVAAHCVHQVRTLLQIGSDSQGRRVFAITSPGAQDGKTSLALALGVSFAAAGSKTLIVDCDLIGGGLTLRVDAIIRRKIGQVLQREQLVTEQQIDEALQIAQESNRRLGETLIELGYLQQEDLEQALSLQEHTPVGLLDALEGEPLEHCVADTGINNMAILPVGAAEAYDVCKVSPTSVRRLLEEARAQYDVIVIDTGPVPGSLEASHICAEADGVVMVVARGEQRDLAEKSVNHLYSIGARVLGLVFNRAEGTDVQVLSASLSDALSEVQVPDEDGGPGRRLPTRLNLTPTNSEEAARFDPVARAVASSANSTRNGSK
ncbi:MAG: AAA family ATPase [Planctomycetes bacterium]|nr:AAA family ATPase [Planctomycetota bacterium]